MKIVHHSRSHESNEAILAGLSAGLDRLESWGIQVSPTSRFVAYQEEFRRLIARQIVSVGEVHRIQFDLREVDELRAIVESFPSGPGPAAQQRLLKVVTGSRHPDEEQQSAGRDAQWELYLRALLRRRGIRVGLGNPDLITTVNDRRIPVEAKRPKRARRFDDRLRKGVSQLESDGTPGVIAFSLDQAIRDGRGVLFGPSLPDLETEALRLVQQFEVDHLDSILRRVRDRPILGIVFHARIPVWDGSTDQPHLISVAHLEVVSANSEEELALDVLLEGLSLSQATTTGSENWPDEGLRSS
jgi:hypothetical protein